MANKFDARQIISRDTLERLASASNPELDNLLRSVNSELTPPFQLKASSTPNLTLNVDSALVTNAETGRNHTLPALTLGAPKLSTGTGTIVFPASSGGTITVTPGNSSTLTCTTGNYVAVLVYLDGNNDLNVLVGAEAASAALARDQLLPSPDETLPIGFVIVNNVGGTIQNITNSSVYQFLGSGGGAGGSGTGNEILETIKDHLIDGTFDLVTPYVVKTSKDTLLDGTSTAAYSIVDKSINFSAASQTLITKQLFDATEFLANTDAMAETELMVFWKRSYVDSAATYHVSRNAGTNWYAVTMDRVGSTELYRGILKFDSTETLATLYSPTITGDLTNLNSPSQSFTIASGTKQLFKQVILNLTKTGSPAGYIYVGIYDDNAGSPGNVLAESYGVAVSTLATGNNTITIPDLYLAAGTYHLKIRTDAAYKASYSNGVTELNLSSETIKGLTLDFRVKITSSTSNVKIDALAAFYDKSIANISTGIKNRQVFGFDGTVDNLNEFTITNFLPEQDILKVYHVENGQVYVAGTNGFSLDGNKVVFPVNTFNGLGTVTLVFDQSTGGAYDNSDMNGLLLSSNHLGSTDLTLDKSVAGRGIMLRSPNGTLFEINVEDDGSLSSSIVS